jgi:replicative DNA helicase
MGVKYFILDTFKMDAGKVSENSWLQMQQAMVDINDVVKPEVKNVHILITFQLAKGSVKQRYYTQDNVGIAKNIIDPASTCIMVRDLYDDEYTGEKRELYVYKLEGKKGSSKIPQKLSKDKRYQIIFIIKNREGAANQYQVVVEHDMSRNIMKEIGMTNVPIDF